MSNIISKVKTEFNELYCARNILKSLVIKDLFGRYKNTAIGFGWHFVMPLIMMSVYYIAFSEMRSTNIPNFWIYLSSGVFPFNFMMTNLIGNSSVIVSNSSMIKKMYFPREIIVMSHVLSSFVVLLIGYFFVILITVITGHVLAPHVVLYLPLIMVLIFFFVLGYTLFFSSIVVYIRDVQHILSALSMVLFFMTPMYFVSSEATGLLKTVIWLNPLTYFVEFYHQIIYYGENPDIMLMIMCLVLTITMLLLGTVVFAKLKKGFAERL